MWANLGHTQSYWPYRHLPNIQFLHYNDMLADLEGSVRQLAAFCRIPVDDRIVARAVDRSTFANVRKEIEATPVEDDDDGFFEGGRRRFFFRGTNGRWRGVLTAEDLHLYDEAKERVLDPDCAAWLETGGVVGAEAAESS
jgi:aryl sulfotransferase